MARISDILSTKHEQHEHGRGEHEDHQRRMLDTLRTDRRDDHARDVADRHAGVDDLRGGPASTHTQRDLFAHTYIEGREHYDQRE